MAAIATAILLTTQAAARDEAIRRVGPWLVSPSSDAQGCFLTRTYPRATTLQLGLDVDGSNRLTILNANWSIREKERLSLDFRLSNAAFPQHGAVGIAADGQRGFVTSFGTGFPGNFAASAFLRIQRGDVPVEDLALDGSGAAVAALRKCVDRHRDTHATGRSNERDVDRIPVDPFAAKDTRESRK